MYTDAWLVYRFDERIKFPFDTIHCSFQDEIIKNAYKELKRAVFEITGKKLSVVSNTEKIENSKNHATKKGIYFEVCGKDADFSKGNPEAYEIAPEEYGLVITSPSSAGVLYAVFEIIRLMQTKDKLFDALCSGKARVCRVPSNPLRILNHWDNMDGSIERGYAGSSFFFRNGRIVIDRRTHDYARLLASVGINATVINNVNVRGAATELITDRYLPRLAMLAEILGGYGIKLYLSLNFAAPMELGGLGNCDPLDKKVIAFWKKKMKEVYTAIPTFGGFLVKADSEGRPGPFTYGRNHADGANMLAKAVAPYGGRIIWRCFVYNCMQDWRDRKTDRARAGYDHFMPLDGQFEENVILQIKNGPMDFQVREAVSPLFSGLKSTNMMLEVQAAQEYTGQQKHLCYLIPMWKEVLGFKTYAAGADGTGKDTVADIVSGELYHQTNCGIAAVANTGDDCNWTGHDMAAANFFGFGRLAFDNSLTAAEIAREWIRCTYGCQPQVEKLMLSMLLDSWHIYESYTSPLGIGWMVNPSHHYGPNVDGYEYDRWGTYHYSDCHGLGVDRTMQGTGYVRQYNEPNVSLYENTATCPDELLLFFHHVPYTHVLHSGKTVIQHIYDSHFEGADAAARMAEDFKKLKKYLPVDAYERILGRLMLQAEHAKEWRDRINTYYFRMSGIADAGGRKIY